MLPRAPVDVPHISFSSALGEGRGAPISSATGLSGRKTGITPREVSFRIQDSNSPSVSPSPMITLEKTLFFPKVYGVVEYTPKQIIVQARAHLLEDCRRCCFKIEFDLSNTDGLKRSAFFRSDKLKHQRGDSKKARFCMTWITSGFFFFNCRQDAACYRN